MSAARRPRRASTAPPNPSGAHALADHAARALVRDARVRPGELVLDIGAGLGALTQPLAATGGRIIAIERDERTAARLRRRMAPYPNVTVVTGDALRIPLPGRPFRVVANIPFGITTPLLRRLMTSRMLAGDLVVALGAGRGLAASPPVRRELARWHRRYAFTLGPVIPALRFRPPPPMPAVVLKVVHRSLSFAPPTASRSPRSGRARR